MKKILTIVMVCCAMFICAQDNLPNHTGNVTDLANLLSPSEEAALHAKLTAYEDRTTNEIAVATVGSLNGYDISDLGNALFRKWGIGRQELNNGILILIAPNERKWRIEIGRGLEEYITDGYSKIRSDEIFKKYFRQKQFATGINALVDDFITKMEPVAAAQPVALQQERQRVATITQTQQSDTDYSFLLYFFIFAGIAGVAIYFIRKNYLEAEAKKEAELNKQRLIQIEEQRIRKEKQDAETAVSNLQQSYNTLLARLKMADKEKMFDCQQEITYLLSQESEISTISQLTNNLDKITKAKYLMSDLYDKLKRTLDNFQLLETTRAQVAASVAAISARRKTAKSLNDALLNLQNQYGVALLKQCRVNHDTFLTSSNENLDACTQLMERISGSVEAGRFSEVTESMQQYNEHYNKVGSGIDVVQSFIQHVASCQDFVRTNVGKLTTVLQNAERTSRNSDVSRTSRNRLEEVQNRIGQFRDPSFAKLNPLEAYALLNPFAEEVNTIVRRMDGEIADAERQRREEREREERAKRQREQDARDEAARLAAIVAASSYSSRSSDSGWSSSSSTSDWGSSSSSSDSGSSFGGGDSGGGGSSGDW